MSEDEPTPRQDLSDRYKKVIDIQTKSIENFDDKTWRTMRVTGVILGVGIGAVSFFSNSGGLPDGTPFQIIISISVLCFISSFGLGIRCYQSTEFATGPNEEIGEKLQKKQAEAEEYRSTIVENYTDAIGHNKTTLKKKKRKFQSALIALFLGIWTLALGFLLVVWEPNTNIAYLLTIGGLIAGAITTFITLSDGGQDEDEDKDGEEKE